LSIVRAAHSSGRYSITSLLNHTQVVDGGQGNKSRWQQGWQAKDNVTRAGGGDVVALAADNAMRGAAGGGDIIVWAVSVR
jgi:hypothetical protein